MKKYVIVLFIFISVNSWAKDPRTLTPQSATITLTASDNETAQKIVAYLSSCSLKKFTIKQNNSKIIISLLLDFDSIQIKHFQEKSVLIDFYPLITLPETYPIYQSQSIDSNIVTQIKNLDEIKKLNLNNKSFIWKEEFYNSDESIFKLYIIDFTQKPILSNAQLNGITIGNSKINDGTIVELQYTREGQKIFYEYTTNHIQEFLSIMIQGYIFSAPQIQDAINTESSWITGMLNHELHEFIKLLLLGPFIEKITIDSIQVK